MAGLLRDTLERLQEPQQKRCKLGKWLESLDEEDRIDAETMLSLEINDFQMTEELRPFIHISRDTVRLHRDELCVCHH